MTNDEAEKLARELKDADFDELYHFRNVRALCDHILSRSMKREIENAAYQRGVGDALNRICRADVSCVSEAEDAIRALIQPPAQTRDSQEMGVYFQPPQEAIKSTTIFKLPAQKENEEC